MNVLVTGSEGYIGCRLVNYLSERGHEVVGLDTGFYTDGLLYDDPCLDAVRQIRKDIRHTTEEDVTGFDAVVHLAELSNDPLGMHNRKNTFAINHQGSVHLARLCKQAGVPRFVYTSSCSVYGMPNGETIKTERSDVHPLTPYAECKILVERDVTRLADDTFSPTFLRNATAYGPSPRMRFDIVLNNLTGYAWTDGEIRMRSDGSPWRPMVHVLDICQAIACALEAPREVVHAEVFNVGHTKENYQVRDIAETVARIFPDCDLTLGGSDGDDRSYRVSFEKIETRLPGFTPRHTLREGAEELRDRYAQIDLSCETFGFRAFTRLAQLKHLINTHQLDGQFFWKNP